MKSRNEDIQNQVIQILVKAGYTKDKWGHYTKPSEGYVGVVYRYKFSQTALRREVRSPALKGWLRLRSNYWKGITINEGKIVGLKRGGCGS